MCGVTSRSSPPRSVARDYLRQWADSGLPGSLAALDTPLETVWAAVQLALSGANLHTLASTLRLSDETASHMIIDTTRNSSRQRRRWPPARRPDQWPASRRGRRFGTRSKPASDTNDHAQRLVQQLEHGRHSFPQSRRQ
jgi:hypothetical protein